MGKKSSKAPDYTKMAETSDRAIAAGERMGNRQMDFAERQYDEMQPLLSSIAESQIAAQDQQLTQAQDYYDYQVETFRPVEQGLVADAQNFSTDSYRDRMAGEASAAAGRAFSNTQGALARSDAARGLNPNSPAARAARQQASLGLAANRSNAMTSADGRAEQMGWARRLDATGLGRNLAGASSAAYQGSAAAGNAGAGTSQQAGNAYMGGMGQAAGTYQSGYQNGMSGLQGIMDSQTNIYNTNTQANSEMISAGLGLAGGIYSSDRRLKHDIKLHHVDQNSGINMYTFRYNGINDRLFLGVMADEIEPLYPATVVYDELGFASVDYAALGLRFVEMEDAAQ